MSVLIKTIYCRNRNKKLLFPLTFLSFPQKIPCTGYKFFKKFPLLAYVLYHPMLSFLRLEGFVNYANFYSILPGLNPETHLSPVLNWMKKVLFGFLFTAFFLLATQLQAQTVFITKTGAKYHKESCRYAKTGWASDLAAAKKKGLTACLVCKPSSTETGQTKLLPLSSGESKAEPKKETKPAQTSSQYKATTKAGTRCSRKSAAGSSYCWQHDG